MHRRPLVLGKAEVLRDGNDGAIICYGTQLKDCLDVSDKLRDGAFKSASLMLASSSRSIESVFWRPSRSAISCRVEEGVLMGGFGSAVLEAASDAGLNTSHVRRLGIPDRFSNMRNEPNCLPIWGWIPLGIAAHLSRSRTAATCG